MATGFTAEEIDDGVCVRTEYVPARRGVRPHRQCLMAASVVASVGVPGATARGLATVAPGAAAPAVAPGGPASALGRSDAARAASCADGWTATPVAEELVIPALRVLWVLARRGRQHTSERTFRSHLRGCLAGRGHEVLLDMVRRGWVIIERTLTPVGDVKRSVVRLTPAGRQAAESWFGPLEPDAGGVLLREVESWLSSCCRPEVAAVLRRQAEALARGEVPVLRTGPGPGEHIAWHPAERARRYEKALAFLALLGTLREGEALDFKEAASRLFPGQVDSVKALEDVRPLIAAVVRYELGCELEETGIAGDTLYSLMFSGVLAPEGSDPLWGEVACLSTYDLRRISHLDTPAHTLLLVENAAPLAAAARDRLGREGYLVAYLGGMPQSAFFHFLARLRAPALRVALLWVDWDVGGLRILRHLRQRWPSHLPDLRVVPHPRARREPQCEVAPQGDAAPNAPSRGLQRRAAAPPGGAAPGPWFAGETQAAGVRREEVPETYLHDADPLVAGFAADLRDYGCLYQEEVLSIFRELLPPPGPGQAP